MPHGTGIFLLSPTITLLHGGLIVQEVPLEDCGNVPQIAQTRAGSPIVTGSDYWLATVAPSIVGWYVHYTLYQATLTPLLCVGTVWRHLAGSRVELYNWTTDPKLKTSLTSLGCKSLLRNLSVCYNQRTLARCSRQYRNLPQRNGGSRENWRHSAVRVCRRVG